MAAKVRIPNNWEPRPHQLNAWQYFASRFRDSARLILVWHRRAGKDSLALNATAWAALQTPGNYWHLLPQANQARRAIWDGIDNDGQRIIDRTFPKAIRTNTHEAEMKITLVNGSTWQVGGSDRFDALVGSNPKGVVLSEYAVGDPRAWDFIRPILLANKGWAIFPSTPRGRNHLHHLFTHADPERHFAEILTCDDTYDNNGKHIITPDDIAEERRSGMSEELIQQEYFCSWQGGMEGAIYTNELADIQDHRMGHYPHDTDATCIAAWDLGFRDATAICILQKNPENGYPVLLDYIEDRNLGLPAYVNLVKRTPYNIRHHFLPHDSKKHEFGTGMTIVEQAERLGIYPDQTPNISVADGINATRAFLRRLYVDENTRTRLWFDTMQSYRRVFDSVKNIYTDKPLHDWTSHCADATRYAALTFDPALIQSRFEPMHTRPKVIRAMR